MFCDRSLLRVALLLVGVVGKFVEGWSNVQNRCGQQIHLNIMKEILSPTQTTTENILN